MIRTFTLRRLASLAAAAALALAAPLLHAQPDDAATSGQPQTGLPVTELSAGLYRIQAQVAYTTEQRETGLMYRREMPDNEGMLFVFERPGVQCFWMKNTLLPLTAAFVADDGRIVNLADMQPRTLDSHCSAEPVRYVLEMNQGWFARKRVLAGSTLGGDVFRQP
ncbi:MAG: DUF192 domain-containing protein [Comamonas sp.]